MSESEDYECELDEASKVKAREELNEIPEERLSAVQCFQDWINRQPWLKTPTNTKFLLSFLRTKKFSQIEARGLLERYWSARTNAPEWTKGVDPADPNLIKIIKDTQVYIPLPGRDKDGRKVIFSTMSKMDYTGRFFGPDEFTRAVMPIFDFLLLEENIQVNGFTVIVDCTDVTLKAQAWFGMDRIRKGQEMRQKAFPARMKEIHYYKAGPVMEALFNIVRPFMTEKWRKRMVFHTSMTTVYEKIDMSMLPKEYLPDDYEGPTAGSLESILEKFIQEEYLVSKKKLDFLRDLYNGSYGVDLSKKAKDDVPQASFRKLNVF
ncbi:hypothetical protein CHS0354_000041 [Potamilus streckersoni]|uniref:CRAL-TRIO domain-containing protein n=1 Tax=Potamilus streckersoni TaxID=2493646 RepID=A0AAE0W932_9BIVA|nr:hypothetical protein CHS0354_000041 [Potamilus streckersoni]